MLEHVEFVSTELNVLWSNIAVSAPAMSKIMRAAVVAEAGWLHSSIHSVSFLPMRKSRHSAPTNWSRREPGLTLERRCQANASRRDRCERKLYLM